MKRFVLAFGLIGLVGCFLPFIPGLSFFDMRHFDAWPVYLVLAAYAIPTLIGASKSALGFGDALGATGAFGYLLYKFGTGTIDLILHGSIGAIMMGVAAVG